jgi:S-(hydroxymethyl)glutathione dehydrogenase / alcohol dehydrogenase
MKAVVYDGSGRPRMAEVDLADPGPGEVEVDIVAAGVCHSDLHVVNGDWDVPVPVVLGHEGAGVVRRVGPGVDDLAPGDHVVLSWVPACGRCKYCTAGLQARCQLVATVVAPLGVLHDGTTRLSEDGRPVHHYLGVSSFAERAVVPRSGAVRIRTDVPLDLAALVGCAVATGVGAVRNTARVEAGATVAVIGCGGVGLAVVQGARLQGASRIVAIDRRGDKLDVARACGATDVIDSSALDPVQSLLELLPDGVDYVFDAVGAIATIELSLDMLALGGTTVVVGLPPVGSTARFDPLKLAESEQRIIGCNYGSIDPQRDIPWLIDQWADGALDIETMVSARRPIEDAADALDDLATGAPLRQLLIL